MNNDNDQLDTLTDREIVIAMFEARSVEWMEDSVHIANQFPNAWEAIEDYVARNHDMVNLRLTNLLFEPHRELVEYAVVEHNKPREIKLAIPLSVLIETNYKGPEPAVVYLEDNPPISVIDYSGSPEQVQKRKMIENALRKTQEMYPDMYIDISRMVEIEDGFATGQFFHGSMTETKQ